FPGPDRPSPPGRGGHKRAPRRRAALPPPAPPLRRTRHGRHRGTGGEVSAGSGGRETGRSPVPSPVRQGYGRP
ncbi:unnamed protein product, partial [Coccothraustes coccothraustes]